MRTRSKAITTQVAFPITPETFEQGLNAEQVLVVRYVSGPLRVLALAGSGKTECLGRLIARMVTCDKVDASRILAVTFSTKGAEEMRHRISNKFGVQGSRISTWHSLCLQILREDNREEATWQVEDSGPGTSAKVVLKDVLGFKGMEWKGHDLSKVQSFIGLCKANLFDPESAEAMATATRMFGWQASKATRAFHLYNEALREKGLLTYDDFLVFAAKHLQSDEHVRATWAAKWDYVMQDEKQDANRAQDVIAELLARDHRNYVVIGDCYQAIYGFRGSSPEFLAQFNRDWPEGQTITLPRNYRSGRRIIDVANAIVSKAVVDGIDAPTSMIGERDSEGEVRVVCAEALDDEGNIIGDTILRSVIAGDTKYSAHTILFRTNAQSRALEESLLARRIPYVVVGGVSFYERKEVRDLLAYLRLADRRASTDDIKRSINTPFRFLGAKFVEKVMNAVDIEDGDDVDWADVVDGVADGQGIQGRQRDSAHSWARLVREMQNKIDAGSEALPEDVETKAEASPARLLDHVVRVTGYIDFLNKEEGGETTADSSAANVREMVRVAERFATASDLLDYIDTTIKAAREQRKDKQAGGERVTLMSVHRSKGLEWPHVYVAGMNEMILPHVKGDDQEERRLAYVAVTRARDVLTMTYVRRIATRAGVKDVEPSRYLLDTGLPLDLPGVTMAVAVTATDPFASIDETTAE